MARPGQVLCGIHDKRMSCFGSEIQNPVAVPGVCVHELVVALWAGGCQNRISRLTLETKYRNMDRHRTLNGFRRRF